MVIAIIGVLAAVLIPTFSGAIDSARQASDKSDVTHMNQELMIYKIQENVSSVDYHSALLWLTTNGYSLESSAKGYAYWFDEDAEQLVYAQVDEAITNANVVSADGDEFYDDPGKIAANKNLTLIDRRTDNPIITAVNGIRNLVQEASSAGSAAGDINAKLAKSFEEIVNAAGNDKVTAYLNNFAPANTLYITENGVYTALTGSATAVVFSDTLRIIDKSTTGNTSYPVQGGAVIELPKTVALVMEGALSGIEPASGSTEPVKITAEKAQFMKDSISDAVKDASDIETIEVLEVTGGSISFEVEYTYREAVVEYKKTNEDGSQQTIRQTIRQKLSAADQAIVDQAMAAAEADTPSSTAANVLDGNASDYLTKELLATEAYEGYVEGSGKVLREYLVPTFEFDGSFANVSGIDVQMKKDGDLTVFYGITYGKNGTISQVVTFGYWSDATVGFTDQKNDQNSESFYQYTASDPLRGYQFDGFYGDLTVTAYYTGTIYTPAGAAGEESGAAQTADSTTTQTSVALQWIKADHLYRSMKEDGTTALYFNQKPDKFTVSSNGLVLYAEYIQQETTASGSTGA